MQIKRAHRSANQYALNKIIQSNYIGEKEISQMNKEKYKVNFRAIEDVDTSILIEAAVRYLNSAIYPNLDTFAAILGVEKLEEK